MNDTQVFKGARETRFPNVQFKKEVKCGVGRVHFETKRKRLLCTM